MEDFPPSLTSQARTRGLLLEFSACSIVLTSRFPNALSSGQGMGWGEWETHHLFVGFSNAGVLLQSSCSYLLFRTLKQLCHEFCPGFMIVLSDR